jgi:hypothetical protein
MDTSIPDYIIIKKDGKSGLADRKTGEIVIPCIYTSMTPCKHNFLEIRKEDDEKWSLLKLPEQKMLTDIQYDDISSFGDKYFKLKKDDLYGIMDLDGNIVVPVECTDIKSYTENVVLVKKSIIK